MRVAALVAAATLACVSSAALLRSRDEQAVLAAAGAGEAAVAGAASRARWPAESAPDGLTLVATISEKTADDQQLAAPYLESLSGGKIGESNALVTLQKMERGAGLAAVDVAVKQSKSGVDRAAVYLKHGMSHEDIEVWADHHLDVARDLSAGTLLCSGAAFCHASTPVMATFGAVVSANNQAMKVVVDTIVAGVTAENPPKVVVKDLDALLLRAAKPSLAHTLIAWDTYTGGIPVWPPTPLAASAAGSIVPSMRDLDAVLLIIQQSINGLAHLADRGMGHRDIKPPNIMLDGPHRTAKLIDFGTACIVADGGKGKANTLADDTAVPKMRCESNSIAGTAQYLAPNGLTGYSKTAAPVPAQVLARGDLFSLGLVMLQLLARADATNTAGHPVPVATDAARAGTFPEDLQAFSALQHIALARFISTDLPAADSDDVARSRLLSIIRIAAGSPREHLYGQEQAPAADTAYFFSGAPLAALEPSGRLVPQPETAPAAHKCIPMFWGPKPDPKTGPDYCLLPCRDGDKFVNTNGGPLPQEHIKDQLTLAAATPTRSIPKLTTDGVWTAASKSCVFSGNPATADTAVLDEVRAAAPAAAAAGAVPLTAEQRAALRAILDALRGLLRLGALPAASPEAVDWVALEDSLAVARERLAALAPAAPAAAAAPAAGAAPARTPLGELTALRSCAAKCGQAVAGARGSAAYACSAWPAADAAGARICAATLAELDASGARAELAKPASAGLTPAAERALCRTAVCADSSGLQRVVLPGAITKAPFRSLLGSYSAYTFALDCVTQPGAASSFDIIWTRSAAASSLPRWMRPWSSHPARGDETGRGSGIGAVADSTACPTNGGKAVAKCLTVQLKEALSNGITRAPATLTLTGITAAEWAAAVAQLKAICPGMP